MIFCNNQILNVITNKWNKAMEIIKIINTIDSPKIPKKSQTLNLKNYYRIEINYSIIVNIIKEMQ